MKKICLIVVLMFCIFFASPVEAKNYSKFTVYATFNGVDKADIPAVYVSYGFVGEEDDEDTQTIKLSPENNFTVERTDIPYRKFYYETGSVEGDRLGDYDVDCDITFNGDDEVFINVIVGEFIPRPLTDATTQQYNYPAALENETTESNEADDDKEENEEKEKRNKVANYATIIVYSLLFGVVLVAAIVILSKVRKASNLY